MPQRKQSFLERLTGTVDLDRPKPSSGSKKESEENDPWDFSAEETVKENEPVEDAYAEDEGELAVDMYIAEDEIVVQAMIAGVTPENLHISITRDVVLLRGKRIPPNVAPEEYAIQELYWGAFARKIELPYEIDTDNAEAVEKYGLLIIRLPKLDIGRSAELKVKSI